MPNIKNLEIYPTRVELNEDLTHERLNDWEDVYELLNFLGDATGGEILGLEGASERVNVGVDVVSHYGAFEDGYGEIGYMIVEMWPFSALKTWMSEIDVPSIETVLKKFFSDKTNHIESVLVAFTDIYLEIVTEGHWDYFVNDQDILRLEVVEKK